MAVLLGAIDEAFADVESDTIDTDFVDQLKHNQQVFAAFKTHAQQNELVKLLINDEGKARSFSEFKKACEPILGQYNNNWLQTEYNTSLTRARFAANVKGFERDSDQFPNMEWTPSRSPDRRPDHEIFYGTVLPINHPFWNKHHPGDLYNCKCGIEQTNKKATREPKATDPKVAGLDESPLNGAIFTNTHPFIAEAGKGAKKAVKKAVKK
jgi:hypothetical protein